MEHERRKTLKNFFVLREVQLPYVRQMMFLVLMTTLVSVGAILAAYFYAGRSGSLYFMSHDFEQPLIRKDLLSIALPGLFAAEGLALLAAFCLALWASRHLAVLLYKIRYWAAAFSSGDLTGTLHFREKKDFSELIETCNSGVERVRTAMSDLDQIFSRPSLKQGEVPREELMKALADAGRIVRGFRFERPLT